VNIFETTPHLFPRGTAVYRRGYGLASHLPYGDLDHLYAGTGEWLQLTPGVFSCSRTRMTLPALRITKLDVNCGVQIRHEVEQWRLMILLLRPANGCQILANGKKYTDSCCVIASGEELAVNVLGAATILWFDLDRRALAEGERALMPIKYAFAPGAMQWWTLATYASDRLAGAAVRDEEIETVVLSMLNRARGRVESPADANREKLVRTALELMWASIEEPPTLREICTAARCSVRTLIYVFNATFGMSPMKYFKIQRLNIAHRRLQSAEPGARVFDIAADCGFWHLGHFGVDYKAFFGTTPRTTPRGEMMLRRARDARSRVLVGSIA
jgi:AraC-like DNA-binding protein